MGDKNFTIHDLPLEERPRTRRFDKVEKYWGGFHDVIDLTTRRCVATLWTLQEAQKDKEYFSEYVGMELRKLNFKQRKFHAKKANDGVWDIVVAVQKFNKRIFDQVMRIL